MKIFSKQTRRAILRKQLKPGSPAIMAAQENTRTEGHSGTKALKVGIALPGITDNLRGIIDHIGNFARQLFEMKAETERIKKQSKVKEK